MYKRLYLLAKSDYGRKRGWYIEYAGTQVGELCSYKQEEQFWDSYKLYFPVENEQLLTNTDLWLACKFTFRNKHTMDMVDTAFASMDSLPAKTGDRIIVRGLYLHVESKFDHFLLNCLAWFT